MKPELMDVHRIVPKAQGGERRAGNVTVMDPPEHMDLHGTLREERWEALKAFIDIRVQVMRTTMKVNNQLLAYRRRTDYTNPETAKWLEAEAKQFKAELGKCSRAVEKSVKDLAETDTLSAAALGVPGIGPITVAYCAVYLDLTKARHASSMWKYAGLHCASGDRFTKGEASGGNKTLRTALYNMACAQIRLHGPYEAVYRTTKARLEVSDNIVKTRNTQGHLVEAKWRDTKPSHRHGAALRAVMKHYLADYWYVGRELLGLPNGPCYAETDHCPGDHHTVYPRERGWEW